MATWPCSYPKEEHQRWASPQLDVAPPQSSAVQGRFTRPRRTALGRENGVWP
ncbi:unnamed protein product [Tetraodon nigroviridis]|uniref:(spotted green pufferfish) hypothetical protein n=1 Tax=Tetraodon nigroviridis TaxID=99883 RepID=Q4SQF3_TETNG|nr:unnamed protein product [Tetraodon nigroviridis]